MKAARTIGIVFAAMILGAAIGFGVVLGMNAERARRVEAALALVSGTAEAGKLVLAESSGIWEGVRRVPASILGIRSDWQVRYRAGYLVRWYVDLLEDGPPRLALDGETVRVSVPALRAYPPQLKPETFAIMAEDRSILVDEERAKVELIRALGEELSSAAPNLVDTGQAREIAAESLRKLVRDACVAAGLTIGTVEVAFESMR